MSGHAHVEAGDSKFVVTLAPINPLSVIDASEVQAELAMTLTRLGFALVRHRSELDQFAGGQTRRDEQR